MEDWPTIHLIFSILNAIFSVFIVIMYIKSRFSNSYAYYFNILFTLVICIRNILRIIQKSEADAFCYIQAFILSTLDKLIQIQISSYSVINYIGLFQMKFYQNNEKHIFIFLTAFSVMYSLILSTIFISQGLSGEAYCCYVKTSATLKRVLDTLFSIILLLVNVSISIKIIITLCQNKKKESNNKNRLASIRLHLVRFFSEIIFVTLIFLIVIFTVNKIFTEDKAKDIKEITYEILLLIMELFYTMNREIFKEIKRIILCQKDNNKTIEEIDEKIENLDTENAHL